MRSEHSSKLTLALVGFANVGKSVIFNQLTGLHQHVGNWPGKTIERAEGSLYYNHHLIDILDLPGIDSLATYSMEEQVTREYLLAKRPDCVINVVDSTSLEANLVITLQLLELEIPVVIALNMTDLLERKGIKVAFKELSRIMGVPVVPMSAITGEGVVEILDAAMVAVIEGVSNHQLLYGREVEDCILTLKEELIDSSLSAPKRFTAIKLLEKDQELIALVDKENPKVVAQSKKLIKDLEGIHGHDAAVIVADERCLLAARLANQVSSRVKEQARFCLFKTIEYLAGHRFFGYPIMMLVLGLMFTLVFTVGGTLSSFLEPILSSLEQYALEISKDSMIAGLFYSGLASFFALLNIAVPYLVPFYVLLFALEDSGYLARIAYLMDNFMHRLGIHGKGCIPLILGLGCNVPACLSCRIMETYRERLITSLLAVFVPCSAVTIIVVGLVGRFLGLVPMLAFYLLLAGIIFLVGKVAAIITPGEPMELIMRMPSYKVPSSKTILKQTWFKLKEFLYIAGPIVIVSGLIIEFLTKKTEIIYVVNQVLSPITVDWLGLPLATGSLLIFGILRKELILIMLGVALGMTNFIQVLTKLQIFTLALVSALYIPCTATIAALWKELGGKNALIITAFKIGLAITLGGIVTMIGRVLS